MPKVDLNPLQESQGADLTSISGYQKMFWSVVSFGVFFTLLALGRDAADFIQTRILGAVGLNSSNSKPTLKL